MEKLKTDQYVKKLYELLESESTIQADFTRNLHTLDMVNKGMQLFKWKNIPDEINKRTIEKRLFFKGKLVFFKHNTLGYQLLPFVYSSGLNDDGEYIKLKPISIVGIDYPELTINEDCVIIRDNELEIPPFIYANYYGNCISELFSVREKNNNWLNLPFIFNSTGSRDKDSKRALEVKQVMIDGKHETAVVTNAFDELKLFDLKPQYFGGEIEEQIKVMKNNYLEYLGIDHLNFDKKERMITPEVEVKQEENSINLDKRFNPRKEACEKINKMFGLSMNVETALNLADSGNTTTMNIVTSKGGKY